ncbi:MAG TPA: threonine synthase, partial [Lachnospiraceae bacterium]|nr:threonine synthase [Lachnospiraceae bacterium]
MENNQIIYRSTRSRHITATASDAILQGIAPDGGLFVPERFPEFTESYEWLSRQTYQQVALKIMGMLLTDFTQEELKHCIDSAYDSKFDIPEITRLKKADHAWYLELFHGTTIAFKDMALSILPHLMTTAARKRGVKDEIVILTATSGDTGKAAMAGFADVPGTKIIVFYPKGGV